MPTAPTATAVRRAAVGALFAALLACSGAPGAAARTTSPSAPRYSVPVLTYHRIVPAAERGRSRPNLCLEPELFAAQLEALHRAGWKTITAAALYARMSRGIYVPPKTFVITIDDGYVDGLTYALPILQRLGYTATYYVIAGRVGGSSYLSAAQIRALMHSGMEIGNHTVTHTPAKRLDAASAAVQVARAQELLEQWTGRAPVTFAYPFGSHPRFLEEAVAAAGLRMAFTTEKGDVRSLENPFALPRYSMGSAISPEYLVRLVAASSKAP